MPADGNPAVLIVGGGSLQTPAMLAARSLGYDVWVTDRDPDCPGALLANRFIPLDIYDVDAHVALARECARDLAGVFTTACNATVTVAAAAAAAGLPGIPVPLAETMADKLRFRVRLADAGLAALQPAWAAVTGRIGVESFARDQGFPVIVKATNLSGGRGHRIVHADGALAALDDAPALVEEYVAGDEVSVDTLWIDGTMVPLNAVLRLFAPRWLTFRPRSGNADLPMPWPRRILEAGWRTPIELGHISPAPVSADRYFALWMAVEAVGSALGYDKLVGGHVLKCDLVLTEDGVKVLEATPRLSGNWDSGLSHHLAFGRDLTRLALSLAVGRLPHPTWWQPRHFRYAVVLNLYPERPGLLESVSIPSGARAVRRFQKPVRIPAVVDGYASSIAAYAAGVGASWLEAYLDAAGVAGKVVFHVERSEEAAG